MRRAKTHELPSVVAAREARRGAVLAAHLSRIAAAGDRFAQSLDALAQAFQVVGQAFARIRA